MKVKIKKQNQKATIPQYAKPGDVGMDLTAVTLEISKDGILTYDTGLCFEIPDGHYGMIALRSSNYKTDLMLTNHIGIIDSQYRGTVSFKFCLTQPLVDIAVDQDHYLEELEKGKLLFYPSEYGLHWGIPHVADVYKIGDRIGQLIIMPYPTIEFEEAEELTETERGSGGYGSTGK